MGAPFFLGSRNPLLGVPLFLGEQGCDSSCDNWGTASVDSLATKVEWPMFAVDRNLHQFRSALWVVRKQLEAIMSQSLPTKRAGQISRRGFLATTTAAGAAVALPTVIPASVLGAAGKAAPRERIGVGIIGLGRQCVARNLPVFRRSADGQGVAVCDVDSWRL